MEKKPEHFEVCRIMAKRGLDIRLSLLDNVSQLTKTKHGTKVTIGIYGDVVSGIAEGRFVGGLLLCDREQYFSIVRELEQKIPVPELKEKEK